MGSPSPYHGKTPEQYAWSNCSDWRLPPIATRPFSSADSATRRREERIDKPPLRNCNKKGTGSVYSGCLYPFCYSFLLVLILVLFQLLEQFLRLLGGLGLGILRDNILAAFLCF